MTFNYMAYMFSARKAYFSIILTVLHREASRLTELHKLSRKNADLHALLCIQGLCLK